MKLKIFRDSILFVAGVGLATVIVAVIVATPFIAWGAIDSLWPSR